MDSSDALNLESHFSSFLQKVTISVWISWWHSSWIESKPSDHLPQYGIARTGHWFFPCIPTVKLPCLSMTSCSKRVSVIWRKIFALYLISFLPSCHAPKADLREHLQISGRYWCGVHGNAIFAPTPWWYVYSHRISRVRMHTITSHFSGSNSNHGIKWYSIWAP